MLDHLANTIRNLFAAFLCDRAVGRVRDLLHTSLLDHAAGSVVNLLLHYSTFFEATAGTVSFMCTAIAVDIRTLDTTSHRVRNLFANRFTMHLGYRVRNTFHHFVTNHTCDSTRNLLANRVRNFLASGVRNLNSNFAVNGFCAWYSFANQLGSPYLAHAGLASVATSVAGRAVCAGNG